MTRLEYIRQFPGTDDLNIYNCGCPHTYGLDEVCMSKNCFECPCEEATINGQPAPFIFACPVKPGQTVYHPNAEDGAIYECEVECIIFVDGGWTANCTNTIGFDADAWEKLIFPTREAAEKRLEEMKS